MGSFQYNGQRIRSAHAVGKTGLRRGTLCCGNVFYSFWPPHWPAIFWYQCIKFWLYFLQPATWSQSEEQNCIAQFLFLQTDNNSYRQSTIDCCYRTKHLKFQIFMSVQTLFCSLFCSASNTSTILNPKLLLHDLPFCNETTATLLVSVCGSMFL